MGTVFRQRTAVVKRAVPQPRPDARCGGFVSVGGSCSSSRLMEPDGVADDRSSSANTEWSLEISGPILRALGLLVQKRLRGPGADAGARRRLKSNERGLTALRQPDAIGEAGP